MATFVLVHGGGHGGWCYRFVAKLLRAEGHEVYTPTLTGLGERVHLISPDVDLDTHIADIVNTLRIEDLSEVILVGHSYGGMVITGVADRATDRVGDIVFLDASIPKDGESLIDRVGAQMLSAYDTMRVENGKLVRHIGYNTTDFYGVTNPALIAWMKPKLTPHPWKSFEQKLVLTNEAAMRKIPQSHIMCKALADRRNVDELRALAQGRLWIIDTGHDLMITEPGWVADKLLQVATRG